MPHDPTFAWVNPSALLQPEGESYGDSKFAPTKGATIENQLTTSLSVALTLPPEGGGDRLISDGWAGLVLPRSPKTPRGGTDLTLRGSYRRPARLRANPLRGEVSLATRRTLSTLTAPANRAEQGFSHPTRLPRLPPAKAGQEMEVIDTQRHLPGHPRTEVALATGC